jgi:surfeit locus 1 family protein
VNEAGKTPLPSWLPLIVGAAFVLLFASLGTWQVSRGLEKRDAREAFNQESGFAAWQDGMQIRPYQRLKVTGSYAGDRQLLLENIIVNSQNGYYVITPLISREHEPALLVNRGWIERPGDTFSTDTLTVPGDRITVRGRAGSLPRAGYKMGDAFSSAGDWPKRAVYPSLDEVAGALGRSVQPFVLLLDDQEPHGFYRQWTPSGFGPGKHFGYALQWFAMGVVLAGLLFWNYRKKRF